VQEAERVEEEAEDEVGEDHQGEEGRIAGRPPAVRDLRLPEAPGQRPGAEPDRDPNETDEQGARRSLPVAKRKDERRRHREVRVVRVAEIGRLPDRPRREEGGGEREDRLHPEEPRDGEDAERPVEEAVLVARGDVVDLRHEPDAAAEEEGAEEEERRAEPREAAVVFQRVADGVHGEDRQEDEAELRRTGDEAPVGGDEKDDARAEEEGADGGYRGDELGGGDAPADRVEIVAIGDPARLCGGEEAVPAPGGEFVLQPREERVRWSAVHGASGAVRMYKYTRGRTWGKGNLKRRER